MTLANFKRLLSKETRKHSDKLILFEAGYLNKELFSYSLTTMFRPELHYDSLAARIVELACKKKLKLILPYLDKFSNSLSLLKDDAIIRSSAKIIELLCVELFIKFNPQFIDRTSQNHKEQFTEACFDWMISDKGTAIQAHSMYSLYLLGLQKEDNWIHEELVLNIDKNLTRHSIGYQNRGKKIINAIKTNRLFKL